MPKFNESNVHFVNTFCLNLNMADPWLIYHRGIVKFRKFHTITWININLRVLQDIILNSTGCDNVGFVVKIRAGTWVWITIILVFNSIRIVLIIAVCFSVRLGVIINFNVRVTLLFTRAGCHLNIIDIITVHITISLNVQINISVNVSTSLTNAI